MHHWQFILCGENAWKLCAEFKVVLLYCGTTCMHILMSLIIYVTVKVLSLWCHTSLSLVKLINMKSNHNFIQTGRLVLREFWKQWCCCQIHNNIIWSSSLPSYLFWLINKLISVVCAVTKIQNNSQEGSRKYWRNWNCQGILLNTDILQFWTSDFGTSSPGRSCMYRKFYSLSLLSAM